MYEVMARRCRPGAFNEVVGQEHVARTLQNAIRRDRVAHAYMFTGGHGCGKTTMARILAKALVCVKGPTPEPCGACPLCVDVAAGRDADVLEIDGASNNGVEQIRQLREQAAYVPARARFKIYIIDEVHMLSDSAFNALLKTLEEPPPHVKFILATTDPHKVPDTILSRCQRFDFRRATSADLTAFFRRLAEAENVRIADDALDAVAAFAGGSVRDGLVLLDQLFSFAEAEIVRADVESLRGAAPAEAVAGLFRSFVAGDPVAALRTVDDVARRGVNAGDFLDQLIAFGRDLMFLVATGAMDQVMAYGPARDALPGLARAVDLETALLHLDVLAQARTRVRSRALSNPLVALEMAVARLSGLGAVNPVRDVLDRLAGVPEPGRVDPPPEPRPAGENAPEPAASAPAAPPATSASAVAAEPEATPPEPAPDPVSHQVSQDSRVPPAQGTETVSPPSAVAAADTADEAGESEDGDDCLENCRAPLTADVVRQAWPRIQDNLAAMNPADIRHMAGVSVTHAAEDVVTLSGPPITIEAWEDRRRLSRLLEAAAEALGRPVMFEFKAVAPARIRERAAGETAARRELLRNPAVETVKALFDGEVVDCRPAENLDQEGEEA
ncbi:MAG: DNA polymerase III subunit gamma/tau [Planctomycetota bacterium]|jgi:DNA polymerase-3 subunit gamma/tau|nr:DNA polymerase III subunit gamma/tau [Planctomycetota bacterium]